MQLVQFIFGIAVLIFVHEMGHFLAARLFKIDVEEFGFGLPPRALKLFEAGGTVFSLNWIPLGGFVRIKGENDPSVPGGMASASPWKRLGVLFAGPTANLLAGVVLAVILFYNLGEPVMDKVQVQGVAAGSPAEQAGLKTGDFIVSIAGSAVKNVDELHTAIYSRLGQPTTMEYERQGQVIQASLTPRNPPPTDEGAIGILMGYATKPTTLTGAITRGVPYVYSYARSILLLPVNLIQGNIRPQDARPVGYKGMYDIYQQIPQPMWFFMMITISLGIFNLFPIPALDGGRIALTLPEILLRRRVPPKFESAIHAVGLVLLLLLLIYINVQDFINPIQLPK